MESKPKGWRREYAAWFEDGSVVRRYDLRPPYPDETFRRLAFLTVDEPRAVLDAGCGPGDLARGLAPLVGRVDAVDRSEAMLAKGRTLPGGDAANLRWIHGEVESAPLAPPYALVVAGESVHWFDWERAIPRFAEALSASGLLAIVYRDWLGSCDLRGKLGEVYARHGANPDFAPLDPVRELERRGLFRVVGEHMTAAVPWTPTAAELIGCHHSQNGFVLERMRDPEAFAREVAETVERTVPRRRGRYELEVTATITCGHPAYDVSGTVT